MSKLENFEYDNGVVKSFLIATVLWGIVGMLVGLIIAAQLAWPSLNFTAELSFGRLRPLHTNAIIFAFVGNGIFMGVYYSLQRLLKARMFSDALSKLHFWGWQLIIVSAALTLPLGYTSSKEYAELEWPIDIAITVVWVIFGINMIGTILKRREKHMYVAIWFYLASFVAVALLHVVNSLAIPVDTFLSYSIFSGMKDALIQWWYGHNAVAFFLTTPYLGLMYYFLPKACGRPVFSYKLSIIHFWSLVFIYIWAGPHHLLYSAIPDWAQSLGIVFSIMLIAPSWGGMLNGLLTLRGAWDKVREQPELKFMVVAVTCYGMATLEGPMLSLKSINALTHFTDYIIGHVHLGGLGWNGFLTFGVLYWLVPKLWNTKLYSKGMANFHFWIGTLGIVVYVLSMYFAGITQGLMWKEYDADGYLRYPNFLDTVTQILPMYVVRVVGGVMYFVGALVMALNLYLTAAKGKVQANEPASAPASGSGILTSLREAFDWGADQVAWLLTGRGIKNDTDKEAYGHRSVEARPIFFVVLTAGALLVGTLVEIVPTLLTTVKDNPTSLVQPYTALEMEGRDLYRREGCFNCHSQMIRPFLSETDRYGDYAKAGEFVYEHPFLWGSRRIGPDLLREGGKYSDSWHFNHMLDPDSVSPGTIMPAYPWMIEDKLDSSKIGKKLAAMRTLGVPYSQVQIDNAAADLDAQAKAIQARLKNEGVDVEHDREIVALIAYLQRLGKLDVKTPLATSK